MKKGACHPSGICPGKGRPNHQAPSTRPSNFATIFLSWLFPSKPASPAGTSSSCAPASPALPTAVPPAASPAPRSRTPSAAVSCATCSTAKTASPPVSRIRIKTTCHPERSPPRRTQSKDLRLFFNELGTAAPAAPSHRAGPHLVVCGKVFNPAQQAPRLRLEDRNRGLRPRKPLHRLQRVKQIHHHKLRFRALVPAQNITAPVSLDRAQSRQNLLLQKSLIPIRVLRLRPSPPMPCNHRPASS